MHSIPAAERSHRAKLRTRKGHRVSDVQSDEQSNSQQNINLETQASGVASAYLVSPFLALLQHLREKRTSSSSITLLKQESSGRQLILPPMSN